MRENFEVFGMLTKDFKARCHVSIDVIMLAVKDAKNIIEFPAFQSAFSSCLAGRQTYRQMVAQV